MILLPGNDTISKAISVLNEGRLVGVPTETVYGLAGDATNDGAVARIYEVKNRPDFNPLIIHGPSVESLEAYAHFNDKARLLAQTFWPGPLTMVLPRKESNLSLLLSAGLDTVAVRIPNHPVMLDLLKEFGKPLAAPSANPSGAISPTSARHVEDGLGDKIDLILDGGDCTVGVESSILDMTTDQPTLLRAGGIALEDIKVVIGNVAHHTSSDIKAPGMMTSHYAPRLPVRLNVVKCEPGEAYLGFGNCGDCTLNLSESGDVREAAANLFRMMRLLDTPHHTAIAIAPIPECGLGLAINDRISRAASDRSL